MRTIYVSPEFPLNRRMRKDVRRGKLQVVREGGERSSLGGGIPSRKGRGLRTTGSRLVCMADNGAEVGGGGGGDDNPFIVDRKAAKDLFEGEVRYWVPAYQRIYRWEKEQWEDFWLDINGEGEKQYTGNIVLRANRDDNGLEIIDGQQRLTTIALFVIAAIRVLVESGILKTESPVKELADVFLASGGIESGDVRNRMKIRPYRASDADFLAELMKAHPLHQNGFRPDPGYGEKSQTQMKKAVLFFMEKLRVSPLPADAIQTLVSDQMGKTLIFSRVVAEHRIRPHPIFATLNGRGQLLTVTELIKNHFLSLCPTWQTEQEFGERWEKKLVGKIGKGGGQAAGMKEFPYFFRAMFINVYGYVQEKLLFRAVVRVIRNIADAENFFWKMDGKTGLYRGFVDPHKYTWPGSRDRERVDMLFDFAMTRCRGLILAAREKFNDSDFSEMLRYCYAIGIRNKIRGPKPRAAGTPDIAFNKAAHLAYSGEMSEPEEIAKRYLAPLYWQKDELINALSDYQVPGGNPDLVAKKDMRFLCHFFMHLERSLGNSQFDPEHVRYYENTAPQMRLGNWQVLETPNTHPAQSRYETTKRTVGMSRDERQQQLAKWAGERVPDWQIDCLEGE